MLNQANAMLLRRNIFALFSDTTYINEIVVSVFLTDCEDKDGKQHPFLRIITDCQKNISEITNRLATLSIDLERAKLDCFIPKKVATAEQKKSLPAICTADNKLKVTTIIAINSAKPQFGKEPFKIQYQDHQIIGTPYTGERKHDISTSNDVFIEYSALTPFVEKLLATGASFITKTGIHSEVYVLEWTIRKTEKMLKETWLAGTVQGSFHDECADCDNANTTYSHQGILIPVNDKSAKFCSTCFQLRIDDFKAGKPPRPLRTKA